MNFVEWCEANGILVDRPPRLGVWERFPTITHPKKRNGAVKWMGDYGFCQDHAAHVDVLCWKVDEKARIDPRVVSLSIQQAGIERKRLQENAAMRASMIVNRCVLGRHDYLRRKGFPDERGLIWCHDKTEHLVIPMYDVRNNLVGAQTIDAEGNKRFLYGQKTSGANFQMGARGTYILCEGYATGLSIREAMRHLKHNWRVVVCFSAGNLTKVADLLPTGFVVADHDKGGAGRRAAEGTGWKFWISDQEGEDFNDYHQRLGLHHAAQSLWRLLHPSRGGSVASKNSLFDAIRLSKASNQGHPGLKSG